MDEASLPYTAVWCRVRRFVDPPPVSALSAARSAGFRWHPQGALAYTTASFRGAAGSTVCPGTHWVT
jgi:hypothetical protein